MQKHQVVVVLLPGGIGYERTENIDVEVCSDSLGQYLRVVIDWPQWIMSLSFLEQVKTRKEKRLLGGRPWKSLTNKAHTAFEMDHMLLSYAIKVTLAEMRPTAKSPVVKAEARIPLDMTVRPTITRDDWMYVGNTTGVRLLFVDMKAPVDTTYEEEDPEDVELGEEE